jgi:hypothetical protein
VAFSVAERATFVESSTNPLPSRPPFRILTTMDRVFLILFARCRRKKGDANLVSAWQRANYEVATYISWPISAITLVLVLMGYAVLRAGSSADHKDFAKIAGVIAWLVVAFLLDRRFRKYRLAPPKIALDESPDEKHLVFRFRAIAFGVFAFTCLFGLLLHHLGVKFMRGF